MKRRTEDILEAIVRDYIETALPIGSFTLIDKYNFPFSSATVRNEMMLLEDLGYIYSPHTSAGRVPTERGYRYFVENFLEDKRISKREAEVMLKKILAFSPNFDKMLNAASRVIAEITGNAGLSGADGIVHHFGLSNLLRQPEFKSKEYAVGVAEMFDNLDLVLREIPDNKETQVFIGEESPIGKTSNCSIVVTSFQIPYSDRRAFLGVIGPTRMSYEKNIEILNIIKKILLVGSIEDKMFLE